MTAKLCYHEISPFPADRAGCSVCEELENLMAAVALLKTSSERGEAATILFEHIRKWCPDVERKIHEDAVTSRLWGQVLSSYKKR